MRVRAAAVLGIALVFGVAGCAPAATPVPSGATALLSGTQPNLCGVAVGVSLIDGAHVKFYPPAGASAALTEGDRISVSDACELSVLGFGSDAQGQTVVFVREDKP